MLFLLKNLSKIQKKLMPLKIRLFNRITLRFFCIKALLIITQIYKISVIFYGLLLFLPQFNFALMPWKIVFLFAGPLYLLAAKIVYRSFLIYLPKIGLDLRMDAIAYFISRIKLKVKRFLLYPCTCYKNNSYYIVLNKIL